jgi:hypothetical protein
MPPEDSEGWFVRVAEKSGRACAEGRITSEELVTKLFDEFAADRGTHTHLAARILTTIPDAARSEFVRRVEDALRPDFRKPPWNYGGPRQPTEEERRRESDELTTRVRAWAAEFRRLLDER